MVNHETCPMNPLDPLAVQPLAPKRSSNAASCGRHVAGAFPRTKYGGFPTYPMLLRMVAKASMRNNQPVENEDR